MSQSITDRMSHVMQINELMSDSIEISYHFDELSNVIDSAMHGTSFNPHTSTLRTVRVAHVSGTVINDLPLENCSPNRSRDNSSRQTGGQIGN